MGTSTSDDGFSGLVRSSAHAPVERGREALLRLSLERPFPAAQAAPARPGITFEGSGSRSSARRSSTRTPRARGSEFDIHMHHGKKREIRLLLAALGFPVWRLRRYQIGAIRLKGIPLRGARQLASKDIEQLFRSPLTPAAEFQATAHGPDPPMKIKTILTSAGLAWCASLGAAPLSVSTAVQSQPDASSPVIAVLAAGTGGRRPATAGAPAGWTAVDLPGPFTGYVRNRDLDKQLDVAPGASVFLAPKDDAGLLAVFAKGDKAEITGLRGGWTQIRLEKTLTGYISSAPAVSAAAAPVAPPAPAPAAPALPAVASSSSPAPQGQAAPPARLFEGKLASSESLLYPQQESPRLSPKRNRLYQGVTSPKGEGLLFPKAFASVI